MVESKIVEVSWISPLLYANNGYLERLTRTDPKRACTLFTEMHLFSKFTAYNTNTQHRQTDRHTCHHHHHHHHNTQTHTGQISSQGSRVVLRLTHCTHTALSIERLKVRIPVRGVTTSPYETDEKPMCRVLQAWAR